MSETIKALAARLEQEYDSIQAPLYEQFNTEEVLLPMADGTGLRTVLVKPEGPGTWPTVVQRSCYAHLEPLHHAMAIAYARRGFAFVYQFCRGTGGSQGKWEPNVNDRADGRDTLAWLDGQAWVKNIGYLGSSYLAFTGWVMADALPDKVRTLYLTHYGTDRFVSAYQRGLFRQDVLTAWAMGNAGQPITADFLESAAYRPQITVDEDLWQAGKLAWYRDWISNTNRTDAYWSSGFWKMLKDIPGKIRVPVYLGASWYDHHLGSALQTWQDLSPAVKPGSTLRIGAWNHMFMPCVEGQEANNLQNSDTRTAFEWFKAHLQDELPPRGQVLAYQIGADAWHELPAYPFKAEAAREFFLSDSAQGPGARLLSDQPEGAGEIHYTYDPDNPVRTHGAESVLHHIREAGSLLQPPCGTRQDIISFVSAPLAEPLHILGRVQARLFVSSDAADTAFTAKLMEVFPDGRAYNIRSSIATLAYPREDSNERLTYQPRSIVPIEIDMWDILWKTKAGSRLRLDISSSSFPEYAAHTNMPGVWALQEQAVPARQTIHTGPEHPSCVRLPLMPSPNKAGG